MLTGTIFLFTLNCWNS